MSTKKVTPAKKRPTEKQAVATAKALTRELDELDGKRTALRRRMQEAVIEYYGIRPGDWVRYTPENALKACRGQVRSVDAYAVTAADRKGKDIGRVVIQPCKRGSVELTRSEHSRVFVYEREHLALWSPVAEPPKPAPTKIQKFERTNWYDRKKDVMLYGIKAWDSANKRWMNVCEGIEPCIYPTEKERDAKLKELRAKAREKGGAE